jgi:hypothetical protein
MKPHNRIDAGAVVFFAGVFVAVCIAALWFLIDAALGAVD